MVVIWYNPKINDFYIKYVKFSYIANDYKIGYLNCYGHKIYAIYYVSDYQLIKCDSYSDYVEIIKTQRKKRLKYYISFFSRFKKNLKRKILTYLIHKLKY